MPSRREILTAILLGFTVAIAACREPAPAAEHAAPTAHAAPAGDGAACACEQAKLVNGWCSACGIGHVGGMPVPSAPLFDAIDAHGHEIDPASLTCAACRDALREDGFCAACGWGFAGGELHFSRLTWLLARGTPVIPGRLACSICREHARSAGWCGACERGLVGHVAFTSREDHAIAAAERERLLASIAMIDRCETCAAASFTGARCHVCGIDYGR